MGKREERKSKREKVREEGRGGEKGTGIVRRREMDR